MGQSTNDPLKLIDATTLTVLVRQVLKRPTARVVDWQSNKLYGGGLTTKIMRFSGNAQDENTTRPWSLILKIIRPADEGDEPTSLRYWKREALAFQTGLLDDLPGNIRAPRCYAVIERPEHEVWLWMEEVVDETKGAWSLEQYGLVAQHVGEFNGFFFENNSKVSHPWMIKNQLRAWLGKEPPIIPPEILSHPLVNRLYPPDIYEWMQNVWAEHIHWLDILERQPKTLSHLDVFRRNAFIRRDSQNHLQTVLIDWAFIGSAALGEEIAALVSGSINFLEFDSRQIQSLDQIVYDGYLEGLQSTGWRGNPRAVRFAYAVGSILKFGIGVSGIAFMVANDGQHSLLEQIFGHPVDQLVDTWERTLRFLIKLTDEVSDLVSKL